MNKTSDLPLYDLSIYSNNEGSHALDGKYSDDVCNTGMVMDIINFYI